MYEYVAISTHGEGPAEQWINKWAKNGWKLICVDDHIAYMERQLVTPPQPSQISMDIDNTTHAIPEIHHF